MKPITTIAICAICTATLMSGCMEAEYDRINPQTSSVSSLSTQHVSGIDVATTLNNVDTLHVSGIDNTVTVTNSNVERIYLSGIGNTVYIPASSDPYIFHSGIECVVKRY